MSTEVMNKFFGLAYDALREENAFLHEHLSEIPYYEDFPHGVLFLYETTMAYLIFRRNLSTNSNLSISWEKSYPDTVSKKCDLTRNHNGVDAFIEIKIWTDNTGASIKSDLEKMEELREKSKNCYELVILRDKDEIRVQEDLEWLMTKFSLREVNHRIFDTSIFVRKKQQTMKCMIVLFEVA
jgi:hypothetical protein